MRKLIIGALAFLLSLAAAPFLAGEASAMPGFARQTGLACNSCHFQHFPTLNAFGRAFKAGGYTMVGGQSLIEGDYLSLPVDLNISLIAKLRYQKRSGSGTTAGDQEELNKGQIQFPDEAAFLVGGRAGEHVGFLLEASLKAGDPLFTSFKVPIVYTVAETSLNVIPFVTDSLGPAYGLELLNTGALRNARPVEHRRETSAQQYINTDGSATGLTFAAAHKLGFANYTLWSRTRSSEENDNTIAVSSPLHYIRVAATPAFGDWDLGVGAQMWKGSSNSTSTDVDTISRVHVDAWSIDAQAQGQVGKYPLGVYVSYANAAKSEAGKTANAYNASTNDDRTALIITGEFGIIPHKLTLIGAYRDAKNGNSSGNGLDSDDAITTGLSYEPIQNFDIQLNNTWYRGDTVDSENGKTLTTLMLFAAF